MQQSLRWALPAFLLVALSFFALYAYSPMQLSAADAWAFLRADEALPPIKKIIIDARLPRILTAIVVGAALAVSGLLLQTMTRNPLSSPSLLSINAGAALGIIMVGAFLPQLPVPQALIAALGGSASWCLVMWISYGQGRIMQNRLILSGIAVSAFCAALGKASLIIAEDHAGNVMRWLAGGVAHIRWAQWEAFYPFMLIPALVFIILLPRLNLLQLADESAQSLGLSVQKIRLTLYVLVLIWVGACVAIAGTIGFIGLLTPHLAKYWIGHDLRRNAPMCALLGALLLLSADMLARALAYPAEAPAGAVLALIGAPCFVLLAKYRRTASS